MENTEIEQQIRTQNNGHKNTHTIDQIFSIFQFSKKKLSSTQIEENKKFGIFDITIKTPNGSGTGKLIHTSDYGFAGCHGIVIPAILTIDGHQKAIQVKHFFKEQGSDHPESDFSVTVDPNKEAEKSYDRLVNLQNLGFNVCPFFALAEYKEEGKDKKVLILEDLSYGGTREVIDVKRLKRQEYADKIKNVKNIDEIRLTGLWDALLTNIHMIDLGNGTQDMYSYDKDTNTAQVYLTDVSATNYIYRSKDPKFENFDMGAFDPLKILEKEYGTEESSRLFTKYQSSHPQEFRLCKLLLEYIKTKLSQKDLASMNRGHDTKLAQARFSNKDMTDKILAIKLQWYDRLDCFEKHGIYIIKHSEDKVLQAFLKATDQLLAKADTKASGKEDTNIGENVFRILENPQEAKDINKAQFTLQQFVTTMFWEGREETVSADLHDGYRYKMDIQVESKVRYKELESNLRSCDNAFIDPRTVSKIYLAPQGRDLLQENKPLEIIENPDLSKREIHIKKSGWEYDRLRVIYFYSPKFEQEVSFDERYKHYKGFEIAITDKENIEYILKVIEELKQEGRIVKEEV